MTVTVFPSDKSSPQQVLLAVGEILDDIDHLAVVYMPKGAIHPRLTCSSMLPVDMNFLGLALQNYSMKYLKD